MPHFPRGVIDALLWWDPYNVTEDADLGIRIARRGWRTATITTTTWEEAPVETLQWFRQRTRWLKGWMQTILVHTRRHQRLRRDLGLWRTLGLHVYMTGLVVSALAHPWLYVGLVTGYGLDALGIRPFGDEPLMAGTLYVLAITTLVAGYAVSIATNIVAGARRGHVYWFQPLLTPFYWLMISAAAYRALYQLATDPYRWEKTKHGLSRSKSRRKRARQ